MILFLMPMYAIQKVPAMRKYGGHISNIHVVIHRPDCHLRWRYRYCSAKSFSAAYRGASLSTAQWMPMISVFRIFKIGGLQVLTVGPMKTGKQFAVDLGAAISRMSPASWWMSPRLSVIDGQGHHLISPLLWAIAGANRYRRHSVLYPGCEHHGRLPAGRNATLIKSNFPVDKCIISTPLTCLCMKTGCVLPLAGDKVLWPNLLLHWRRLYRR